VYQWLIADGLRLPLIGAIHSWSIDPRGPGKRLAYKRRQHAPLPALPMPGAGCCEQYHTTVSQLKNLDTVRAGEGVRAQSLIKCQQRTQHFCRHHPTFNAYVTISRHTNTSIHSQSYYWQNTVHETDISTVNPTWGVIFESSKLKARTSLLPRFSEKRSSSLELWARNSIRKCYPKWDQLTFSDPLSIIKVQPIPLGVTFSNAVWKLKAQSSKVSFH